MSKFQKRHYEAVAETIFSRWSTAAALGTAADAMLNLLIADFHQLFASDNSSFDGAKFVKACDRGPKS